MTTSPGATSPRFLRLATGAAALLALAWLWVCWCAFPDSAWNDLRLAPAFMLARGVPVYPAEHTGVITTWMYGPLPLIVLLPATWASSAFHAVMTAGALNLGISLAAILLVCWFWPASLRRDVPAAPEGARADVSGRVLAAALAVLLWPWASFQFLQADNLAVALGLVANLLLIRARSGVVRWGAALLAVAPLACKQTSVGVIVAQLVWLGATLGWRAAWRHGQRAFVAGLAILALMILSFGWPGVWYHLVVVPSRIPWTVGPGMRLLFHASELGVQLLLPAALLLVFRRVFWSRSSTLLLPSLTWLCALPAGLAAFFKAGGTVNSLQSFPLWLPAALAVGVAAAGSARRAGWSAAGLAAAALALGGMRLTGAQAGRWRPAAGAYRQAAQLARELPAAIWFPCNPLVTIYSDHRFYHDEDGLFVRRLSGFPLTLGRVYAHLPPRLNVIALPRGQPTWGIAQHVGPPGKRRNDFGFWTLYSWPPATPVSPAPVRRD